MFSISPKFLLVIVIFIFGTIIGALALSLIEDYSEDAIYNETVNCHNSKK